MLVSFLNQLKMDSYLIINEINQVINEYIGESGETWDTRKIISLVACCIKTNEVVPYYMIIPKSYYAYRIITIFTYGEIWL